MSGLLALCQTGTASEVAKCLESEDVYACDEAEGKSTLCLACSRSDADAFSIVSLLLKKKSHLVRMQSLNDSTPLHYAARYASAKVVQLLLDTGASVNCPNNLKYTALHEAVLRDPAEAPQVVATLLAHPNIDIEALDLNGNSPLALACRSSSLAVVTQLVKANSSKETETRRKKPKNQHPSYLRNALLNPSRVEAEGIVKLILERELSEVTTDILKEEFRLGRNFDILVRNRHYRNSTDLFDAEMPDQIVEFGDPIGHLQGGHHFGFRVPSHLWNSTNDFRRVFLITRCFPGGNSSKDFLRILSSTGNVEVWKFVIREALGSGVGFGEHSILHQICGSSRLSLKDQKELLELCFRFELNPFVPKDGSMAVDVCPAEIRPILQKYMSWRPSKRVMDWYGPYCRDRMRTFLLVLRRKQIYLPKDLLHLVLSYIAKEEQLFLIHGSTFSPYNQNVGWNNMPQTPGPNYDYEEQQLEYIDYHSDDLNDDQLEYSDQFGGLVW
jgi:hypothetical protein